MAKSKGEHYVDNKVFLQAMIEWKEACKLSKEDDDGRKPAVTNYIGECFLKIATHLSYRPNFSLKTSCLVSLSLSLPFCTTSPPRRTCLPDRRIG